MDEWIDKWVMESYWVPTLDTETSIVKMDLRYTVASEEARGLGYRWNRSISSLY